VNISSCISIWHDSKYQLWNFSESCNLTAARPENDDHYRPRFQQERGRLCTANLRGSMCVSCLVNNISLQNLWTDFDTILWRVGGWSVIQEPIFRFWWWSRFFRGSWIIFQDSDGMQTDILQCILAGHERILMIFVTGCGAWPKDQSLRLHFGGAPDLNLD